MLTVHATIEEEIFYPAARLDEAEVEHASAKELIAQIELMKASDPLYDANCHDQDRAPWTMEDTWACGPAWVGRRTGDACAAPNALGTCRAIRPKPADAPRAGNAHRTKPGSNPKETPYR